MPESYQQRFDRIMRRQPALMEEEPASPVVAAGRASGRLRGLMSRMQLERQARQEELASQRFAAQLARQDAQERLAAEREARMADQFRTTQDRMAQDAASRTAHQQFLERLAGLQNEREAKKAERADAEYSREDAERKRFEPIFRALSGETVPGVKVNPDTFDTTIEMEGKTHPIRGAYVEAMLQKHFGYKIPKTSLDPAAVAGAVSAVSDMARQSGAKLSATDIQNIGKFAAKNPSLLATLPDELEKEATFQKESGRTGELLRSLQDFNWASLPKDTRSGWNPASWFTDKPAALALTGFDEKNRPALLPMDVDKAKKSGFRIISKAEDGFRMDNQPIRKPSAPGPLIQRLIPAEASTPVEVPTTQVQAPSAVSDVKRMRLRNGEFVNVRKDPTTGKWVEVE